MKKIAVAAFLFLSACCGTDHVRLAADKANYAFAQELAKAWMDGKPVTPEEKRIVENTLADWGNRLAKEEVR